MFQLQVIENPIWTALNTKRDLLLWNKEAQSSFRLRAFCMSRWALGWLLKTAGATTKMSASSFTWRRRRKPFPWQSLKSCSDWHLWANHSSWGRPSASYLDLLSHRLIPRARRIGYITGCTQIFHPKFMSGTCKKKDSQPIFLQYWATVQCEQDKLWKCFSFSLARILTMFIRLQGSYSIFVYMVTTKLIFK